MRRAVAIGIAACFVLIGGDVDGRSRPRRLQGRRWPYRRSAFGGNIRVGGGSVGKFHTNPGGKYVGGGVGKFHTNPGGKYVYRGSGSKFHTNPGGKYAYRGWSGKYDNHHHYGHYRRYGYCPRYGLPLYSYGGGCAYLYRRAVATGSAYWWDRYRRCSGVY